MSKRIKLDDCRLEWEGMNIVLVSSTNSEKLDPTDITIKLSLIKNLSNTDDIKFHIGMVTGTNHEGFMSRFSKHLLTINEVRKYVKRLQDKEKERNRQLDLHKITLMSRGESFDGLIFMIDSFLDENGNRIEESNNSGLNSIKDIFKSLKSADAISDEELRELGLDPKPKSSSKIKVKQTLSLEDKLKKAIESENYEQAAEIRDEIEKRDRESKKEE